MRKARGSNIRYAMSRRTSRMLFALIVVVLASIIGFDRYSANKGFGIASQPARQSRLRDTETFNGRKFLVAAVIDGDTLDINNEGKKVRIRLLGIDTPETKHPTIGVMYFGPEASAFTKQKAQNTEVTIYIDTISDTRDKYGRILAYVQLDNSSFLNEILISEGFAYADRRFDHSFFHRYLQLESQARSRKKGLWKEAARDQLPQWLQRMEPKLLAGK